MISPYSSDGLVYRLTFPNGKDYVGVTSRTLEERVTQHIKDSTKGPKDYPLARAIRKYGPANMPSEVLVEGPMSEMLKMEIKLIRRFESQIPMGYNISRGGTAPMFGRHHSIEMRQKMSRDRVGKNNPMWGVPSPNTGRIFSLETRTKMAAARREIFGWKHTTDTKIKMSKSSKKYWEKGRSKVQWKRFLHSGVHWASHQGRSGKWQARIKFNGKSTHIGYFTSKRKAVAARRVVALTYRDQFHF